MGRTYNQKQNTIIIDGIPITDLADGDSIVVSYKGGEVAITEGTDGPGMNVATEQGGEFQITLKQNSPSHGVLLGIRRAYDLTGIPAVCVILTGTKAVETLVDCVVSLPGELSTGNKTMGRRTYTITGMKLVEVPTV